MVPVIVIMSFIKLNDVVKVLALMQHILTHNTNKHFCISK